VTTSWLLLGEATASVTRCWKPAPSLRQEMTSRSRQTTIESSSWKPYGTWLPRRHRHDVLADVCRR